MAFPISYAKEHATVIRRLRRRGKKECRPTEIRALELSAFKKGIIDEAEWVLENQSHTISQDQQ